MLDIMRDHQNSILTIENENLEVGDNYYHNNKQVTIIEILENGIVKVLGYDNGKPFNYEVPVSNLTYDLKKEDFFFF